MTIHRPAAGRDFNLYGQHWKNARAKFLRENPLCEECERAGRLNCYDPASNPAFVVDHRKPHRGDPALFWDRANWSTLCATCHNSYKQRTEKSGEFGCDEDGNPLSADHHWRRPL